jgi:hypothetical protein
VLRLIKLFVESIALRPRHYQGLRTSAFGVVVLALAMLAPARARPALQASDQPPASFGAADKGDAIVRISAQAVGSISYDLAGRSVELRWSWTSTGPRPKQHSVQSESLSFWPTDAIGLRTDRAAIAGVRRGRVVVEVWSIASADLPTPKLDPSTGEYRYGELVLPIRSRVGVFDEAQSATGPVYAMYFNPRPPDGFSDSLFLHFSTSKDLFRVDVRESDGTSVSTKVASTTAQTGVLLEPRLADPFRHRWSAERSSHGYVYIFAGVPGGAVTLDSLVLYDVDRDGMLDGSLRLDGAMWNAGGWGDVSNYVAMY